MPPLLLAREGPLVRDDGVVVLRRTENLHLQRSTFAKRQGCGKRELALPVGDLDVAAIFDDGRRRGAGLARQFAIAELRRVLAAVFRHDDGLILEFARGRFVLRDAIRTRHGNLDGARFDRLAFVGVRRVARAADDSQRAEGDRSAIKVQIHRASFPCRPVHVSRLFEIV